MNKLLTIFKKPSIRKLLPFPVEASHGEYSMILSQHDEKAKPIPSLIKLSLKAIEKASTIDLSDLCKRLQSPPNYPNIWPGEHYRLLAGLVQTLKPKLIIEIGTASGLSALALKKFLPKSGKIVTFDLFAWHEDENTHLIKDDFVDGRLLQKVDDLSNENTFVKHKKLIEQADLIFIDATHDGQLEKRLMDLLETCSFQKDLYLLFDDIRVWTMIKMWREIKYPKLDLTSFGHWSGTGMVLIPKLYM